MTPESIKWIEAGKILSQYPEKKVPCPSCNAGTLVVKDEKFGEDRFERWLICDKCGQNNALLMTAGN